MMKPTILIILAAIITGCGETIPRTVFEVQTTGGVIRLACPVVDSERSEITYLIKGDCVVYGWKSDTKGEQHD